MVVKGVFDGCADQALGAFYRDRFDAQGHRVREADLVDAEFFDEEFFQFFELRGSVEVFDARIDVLRIFTEDDHVHQFRVLYRGRDACEIAYRAHAGIEVELLAQGYVQGADTPTDGRGERPFDGNHIFGNRT